MDNSHLLVAYVSLDEADEACGWLIDDDDDRYSAVDPRTPEPLPPGDAAPEPLPPPPAPHAIQQEALAALARAREEGRRRAAFAARIERTALRPQRT